MLDHTPAPAGAGRHRGRWLTLLALVAATTGAVIIVIAIATQQRAPEPTAAAAGTVSTDPRAMGRTASPRSMPSPSTPSPSTRAGRSANTTPSSPSPSHRASDRPTSKVLPASRPVSITIAAIDVRSAVFPIGKDAQGGLAVPQPGPNVNKVAWYKDSSTPGQLGPAVLEGHVDTLQGPSVFLRLGALTPGNKISVTRADGLVAVFTVNAVRAYPSHHDFPTSLVYGGELDEPTLRIITCSSFDHHTGHYVGNTIVFAHLTAVQR